MKLDDGRDRPDTIPRNSNSIENGFVDPQPEKGPKGSRWRALVSWLKGWAPAKKGDK
jgi:hypothetical protein